MAPALRTARVDALRLLAVIAIAAWATDAGAVQRETCMGAAESAQELKRRGKLREAREQLNVCAQRGCPSYVRRDCSTWLGEVESSMPTVVLRAQDESGRNLTDVRVLVDGTVVASELAKPPDETSVELDPGPHVVRFERTGGAFAEERVTLGLREKSKAIVVTLAGPSTIPSPTPKVDAAPAKTAPSSSPVPTSTYVFGGIGLVALGSFAYFGASGAADYDLLERSCKPSCNSEQLSGVETKFLVANISLAVAAASLGAALVLYLTRPTVTGVSSASGTTARIFAAPAPGGGVASVGASF